MANMIDREELPYLQIARHYRQRGDRQPGQHLSAVRAMAGFWNVPPTTANRALKALQAEGLLQATSGAGTVVAQPALRAESLVTRLRGAGSFYPASYRSVITYDTDGTPVEYSTDYVRVQFANTAPTPSGSEPIDNGMLGYLEARTSHHATAGCDQYAASAATSDQAAALNIGVGDPVLIEERWWSGENELVLDCAESVEPGERRRASAGDRQSHALKNSHVEDPEGNNMDESGKNRRELLRRIQAQRVNIESFVQRVRPRSVRLANLSIISSAIAAVLTAGPAFGGLSFAGAVQHALSLSSSSTVWRALCLVAMLVSLVATISVQLGKSQDMAAQLSAAEACDVELEGLQTLLELQRLPVQDAAELYRSYISKIPFVRTEPVAPGLHQG